jgi:hypothetical protein
VSDVERTGRPRCHAHDHLPLDGAHQVGQAARALGGGGLEEFGCSLGQFRPLRVLPHPVHFLDDFLHAPRDLAGAAAQVRVLTKDATHHPALVGLAAVLERVLEREPSDG